MKMSKKLSAFTLKILAAIFMTIDHIGVILLEPIWGVENPLYLIMRMIGRLSLPLFAFLVVESVFHTRSRLKYLLRLAIGAVIFGLITLIAPKIYDGFVGLFNIFLVFLLGASIIALLELDKYKKLWALIPFSIYLLLVIFDYALPNFLRLEYNFYGVLLIIGFYLARIIAKKYYQVTAQKLELSDAQMEEITPFQKVSNLFAIAILVIINLGYWGVSKAFPILDNLNASIQVIAMFSGIFILFYSGQKGFSNKYIKYGFYLYYPLHLVILYVISMFI